MLNTLEFDMCGKQLAGDKEKLVKVLVRTRLFFFLWFPLISLPPQIVDLHLSSELGLKKTDFLVLIQISSSLFKFLSVLSY